MIHKKCSERVVTNSFDETICQECDMPIISTYTPGDVICSNCSEVSNLCTVCGEIIKRDSLTFIEN